MSIQNNVNLLNIHLIQMISVDLRVRPSHHKKFFPSLLTFTLVHKNSKLSRFLTWLSLFTSTQFLEHIPTDDGITDDIPGSIDFGTNTGGIN